MYGQQAMLVSALNDRLAFRMALALACVALASCDTPDPQATASPSLDACTVVAVMVPIRAILDTPDIKATVAANNGDLRCASGIARITVLIGAVSAPSDGPPGTPHVVLLEDDGGTWVVANDKLCTSAGQPAKPIPAQLGDVCGVQ